MEGNLPTRTLPNTYTYALKGIKETPSSLPLGPLRASIRVYTYNCFVVNRFCCINLMQWMTAVRRSYAATFPSPYHSWRDISLGSMALVPHH